MNTLDTMGTIGFEKVGDLCADAATELEKACDKHPLFADRLTNLNKGMIDLFLSRQRAVNDHGESTGSSIFHEEWGEFLEAVNTGNIEHARHELAQCMAMLMRIAIHLKDYVKAR